jgi:hypothetical protein
MTSTTDFSRKQLATILSALDDAPRNPANRGEAVRAIGRSAGRLGLTTDDVLVAAPGLLDGRLSPVDFRVELQDLGSAPAPATEAPKGAPGVQDVPDASDTASEPPEPAQAAQQPATPAPAADAQEAKPVKRRIKGKARAATAASAGKPTPRAGTKQAQMIEMLKRPEGATVEQIAATTGWQHHTIRGAISGALKKKLGLKVEATRTHKVGPAKIGAKGRSTVYRIVG